VLPSIVHREKYYDSSDNGRQVVDTPIVQVKVLLVRALESEVDKEPYPKK
jgi:hypothetical protein